MPIKTKIEKSAHSISGKSWRHRPTFSPSPCPLEISCSQRILCPVDSAQTILRGSERSSPARNFVLFSLSPSFPSLPFVPSMISTLRLAPANAARTAAFVYGRSSASRGAYSHVATLERLLKAARSDSSEIGLATPTQLFAARAPSIDLAFKRSFHASAFRLQEKQKEEAKQNESSKSDGSGPEAESSEYGKESKEEKREMPPPPPHGDKTPWQVFTETLQSEFKKSKEWNESTKALASSAHQFAESESVKRARAAYEAASSTATSKTTEALKTTGRVIGKGAVWTWETPVVKGIRKGVTATGRGIERITRPVRETEVYKTAIGGVKETIDDGSSSRYGGWLDKEERRRQRQLREQEDIKAGRIPRPTKVEENPK